MKGLNGYKIKSQSLAEVVVALSIISVCLMLFMRTFSNIFGLKQAKKEKKEVIEFNRRIFNKITTGQIELSDRMDVSEKSDNGWKMITLHDEEGNLEHQRETYEKN